MTDMERLMDIKLKSLREHLITVEEFVNYVKDFERLPTEKAQLNFYTGVSTDYNPRRRFCVPYPYTTPAWEIICRRVYPNKTPRPSMLNQFTRENFNSIQNLVQVRMRSHVRAAIPEEIISDVDNTYDYGAIVHRVSGAIVLFNYATLQGALITAIPISLSNMLLKDHKNTFNGTEEEYQQLVGFTTVHSKEMNAWYKLIIKDHETNWVGLTDKSPLSSTEVSAFVSYLTQGIDQHTKVLTVP